MTFTRGPLSFWLVSLAVLPLSVAFQGCFLCSQGLRGGGVDPEIGGCWQDIAGPDAGWIDIDHVSPEQEVEVDVDTPGCDYQYTTTVFSGHGAGLTALGAGAGPWAFTGEIRVARLEDEGMSRADLTIQTESAGGIEVTATHYLERTTWPERIERLVLETSDGSGVVEMIRCAP